MLTECSLFTSKLEAKETSESADPLSHVKCFPKSQYWVKRNKTNILYAHDKISSC